jgi:2-hydroxycyclohexanecarboxyl-CoA dehydrogenase
MAARMAGRIALITGGGGGLGTAIGRLFCAHEAKVLLADRNASALADATALIRRQVPGAQIETFDCDVTDAAQAAVCVARAVAAFGALNVLVNNAAIRNRDPIAGADPAEWERVFRINLLGAVNFSKAAMTELRKSAKGSIVNVSSTYAAMGRKGFGAYDVTKAGLLSLTRTTAWEEAPHGVRVNAVCPGSTLTSYHVANAKARGMSEEQLRSAVKTTSLFGRWAEPDEIAYPILWLASDEASYITGTTLMVDAGTSIM